jgi:hypothetical protein
MDQPKDFHGALPRGHSGWSPCRSWATALPGLVDEGGHTGLDTGHQKDLGTFQIDTHDSLSGNGTHDVNHSAVWMTSEMPCLAGSPQYMGHPDCLLPALSPWFLSAAQSLLGNCGSH